MPFIGGSSRTASSLSVASETENSLSKNQPQQTKEVQELGIDQFIVIGTCENIEAVFASIGKAASDDGLGLGNEKDNVSQLMADRTNENFAFQQRQDFRGVDIENTVNRESEKITSCIWSVIDQLNFPDYFKLDLLGSGGQKSCWNIESKYMVGNFVLLEYHYPLSIQDDMFFEYEEHEKEQAYNEAYELAMINSDKEISILKRLLNCSGILQLQSVLQTTEIGCPPRINAVVEFKNRGNLRELSEQNAYLDSREKLNLAINVLEGLRSVSDANIYLTDIKSENILLDDTSGRLTACLSDFCNAEILEDYTSGDKKHNLECILDIIRHDIYKTEGHCYVDEVIQYNREDEDFCLQSFVNKLISALNS